MMSVIFLVLSIYGVDFNNTDGWISNSFNISIPSVSVVMDEKVSGESEDNEFDPTLPQTPPPPTINIVKMDVHKGRDTDVDEIRFDITDKSQIKYLDLVLKNAKAQNFDVELTLAIIMKESNFNPHAVSRVGAVGLMQILPDTAKWLGLKDTSKLKNPDINIKYGIKYLRYLFSKFAPDMDVSELVKEDASKAGFKKAIAAYNCGPGNVEDYDRPPYNGIPPFRETRDYVKKVPFFFIKFEELSIDK